MGNVQKLSRCGNMKSEMTLKFEKATKNIYVFAALKDDDPIPTVYVRKSAFQKQPEKIKLIKESE